MSLDLMKKSVAGHTWILAKVVRMSLSSQMWVSSDMAAVEEVRRSRFRDTSLDTIKHQYNQMTRNGPWSAGLEFIAATYVLMFQVLVHAGLRMILCLVGSAWLSRIHAGPVVIMSEKAFWWLVRSQFKVVQCKKISPLQSFINIRVCKMVTNTAGCAELW